MKYLVLMLAPLIGVAVLFALCEADRIAARSMIARFKGVHRSLLRKIQGLSPEQQSNFEAVLDACPDLSRLLQVERQRQAVDRRISEIERDWGLKDEDGCTETLCRNAWLLGPTLQSSGHMFANRDLKKIAAAYFPNDPYEKDWKFLDVNRRADGVGVFFRRMFVSDQPDDLEPVMVVIESKNPSRIVDGFVMDEALQYAVNLRKLSKTLAYWSFECFALGRSVSDGIRVQRYRFGSSPCTVTVTPITWSGLLERARALNPESVSLDSIKLNEEVVPPSYLAISPRAAATGDEVHSSEPLLKTFVA